MTEQLFQQQLRQVPTLNESDWRLIIDGYVNHPLTLNYNTLTSHLSTNITAALMCSGHSPEVPMLGEANWEGVSLPHLLQSVKPRWLAKHVAFQTADGYATSLPIVDAHMAYLIHTMNGNPLPAEHGFPVRVLVPGLAGYKQPKWVTHITLREFPVEGFWERRGADSDGLVDPIVTIQTNTTSCRTGEVVELHGLAYAGIAKVANIQISLDGAVATTVWPSITEAGIAHWETTWVPQSQGVYNISATVTATVFSGIADMVFGQATTSTVVEVQA